MYLQQHAALRSCSGNEVRARAGSPRICGRTHVVAPLVGSGFMAAYLIAEHIITDAGKFDEYRTKAAPMIAKHGGKYLTKGGSHKMPEGGHWEPQRGVIIEFPDMKSLDAWYTSSEYQPLIALRKACTSDLDMLFTLEGV